MSQPQALRIIVDWRVLPSQAHDPDPLIVPKLTAVPSTPCGQYEAVLAPSARYTLLPAVVAAQLGVDTAALPRVADPLFPGFALWFWQRSYPLKVLGRSLSDALSVHMPVAFDSSGNLESVVLGERFFTQVRLHLDPELEDGSWIEQFRFLA